MNLVLKLIISIAAFTFGTNAAWMINSAVNQINFRNHTSLIKDCTTSSVKPPPIQKRNGRIELRFEGFKKIKNDVFAELEVVNNSPASVFYSGYSRGENVSSRIKFNGVMDRPLGICGTGLSIHELKPGERMIMKIHSFRFNDHIDKDGNFQIGYYYQSVKNKQGKIYWSEDFRIPNSVKRLIKRNVLIRN